MKDLNHLQKEAQNAIQFTKTQHELNEVKALYLGKKSALNQIMATMKDLSIEDRKALGQEINQFKVQIEEWVAGQRDKLVEEAIQSQLQAEAIDVTLPGKAITQGKLHILTRTQQEIEDIFVGMGYRVVEGPEVELDLYNFEMLNLPVGHPAREMQDSFYINPETLLRTHTSPVQVRTLLENKNEPIKIICPGKVYRRDDDDATHSHQFSQIEGLVVGPHITMSDLKGTLSTLSKKLFGPNREIRFRPSFFPFTEPSVEVDVSCFKCGGKGCNLCKQTGWIEILGAGMVHPNVLRMAGYDSDHLRGFAFGMGIERITLLKYGIDDIRHFYQNDIRFLKQL